MCGCRAPVSGAPNLHLQIDTVNGMERRQAARENLTLIADMRVDGLDGDHTIKVRNLSASGMMGEGPIDMMRGAGVAVRFRYADWTHGSIVWVQSDRFGIAFRDEIDPEDVVTESST